MAKQRNRFITFLIIFALSVGVNLPQSFAATTYIFTNAGASGLNGPTSAQVTSAYSGTNLAGNVSVVVQGMQLWTVPTTGEYYLEVAGASGGYTPSALGGKGRVIKVRLSLSAGTQLKIAVGQEGGRAQFTTGYSGGGGGGTFVYNVTSSSWIAVAGGGGGAGEGDSAHSSPILTGADAAAYNSTAGTSGTGYSGSYWAAGSGGTSGGGGLSNSGGAGGGGITGNGADGGYSGRGGKSYSNNLVGGAAGIGSSTSEIVAGGFGGGGGASVLLNYEALGGGGGGYSGGGGSASRVGGGGGGGNFYTGTYVSNGLNTGHGYASFQLIADPTVSIASAGNARLVYKGNNIVLTATLDDTVKVTFYADGKKIAKCIGLSAVSGTKTCNWKPTVQKPTWVYATISQGGAVVGTSQKILINVIKRSGTR